MEQVVLLVQVINFKLFKLKSPARLFVQSLHFNMNSFRGKHIEIARVAKALNSQIFQCQGQFSAKFECYFPGISIK